MNTSIGVGEQKSGMEVVVLERERVVQELKATNQFCSIYIYEFRNPVWSRSTFTSLWYSRYWFILVKAERVSVVPLCTKA